MPPSFRITQGEYDANVRGLNIVFGAVLGFVLADTSSLPPLDFIAVLVLSASVVVMILYLSHSDYKLFYILTVAGAIAFLPFMIQDQLKIPAIPQLQPTLAAWALMVVLVELLPREPAEQSKEKDQ